MKNEDIVKEQMKTISKLQDKINLLKFDMMQINRENRTLKEMLKRRKENIKNIRIELNRMKRLNDFTGINNVLMMLNAGWDDEYENNSNN